MTRARRNATRPPLRCRLLPQCEPLEGRVVPSTILVTSLLNAGRGTLRAAIQRANLNGHPDTIKFARTALGTILLTNPLPALSTQMVISGWGPSYDTVARSDAPATPDFRIFTVMKGAVVKITGLSIAGGIAREGGGISNAGSLSLVNTNIAHNTALGTSSYGKSKGAGFGGGIENTGKLSIVGSTIGSNSATGLGAHYGQDGGGGGIHNSGRLTVLSSAFIGNTVTGGSALSGGDGDGGGVDNSGTASVTYTYFSGNAATGGAGLTGNSGSGMGGGINNSGSLTLTWATFANNSALAENQGMGGAGSGGGIENSGKLSITSSLFEGNSAMGQYGGPYGPFVGGRGGGITNVGTLSITDSTFRENTATGSSFGGTAEGGGIANHGTISIADSTFSGNSATGGKAYAGSPNDGNGGAIANSAILTVAGCTFTANTAMGGPAGAGGSPGISSPAGTGTGGGIANYGGLTLTNSTLSGNSAGDLGGGMSNKGTASLTYVTVAGNSAPSGGGIAVLAASNSTVKSIDTIYQNTPGGNLLVAQYGTFLSQGYNLFSDTPGVALQPGDLVNTDPLLGPLAGNGGPTLTETLRPGSPAIDAGIAVAGIATDQRGNPRPTSGATDIGAVQA
jgi:hypothetical protein